MKIRAVGNPFSFSHNSTCSNRKPKTIEWTPNPSESSIEVIFDNVIAQVLQPPAPGKRKFGWVCESRTMTPGLNNFLRDYHPALFGECAYEKIFVHEEDLLSVSPNFIYCPPGSNLPWTPESKYRIYEKTKLCSLLCSSKNGQPGHDERIKTLERFKDDPRVDVTGGIFGTPKIGLSRNLDLEWHNKKDALNDYMFSIVSENDICEGYYTEKITDCFATGTIPIYRGMSGINKLFNEDGIIMFSDDFNVDSLSKELYESKMNAIQDNFERVKKLEMADDTIGKLVQRFI